MLALPSLNGLKGSVRRVRVLVSRRDTGRAGADLEVKAAEDQSKIDSLKSLFISFWSQGDYSKSLNLLLFISVIWLLILLENSCWINWRIVAKRLVWNDVNSEDLHLMRDLWVCVLIELWILLVCFWWWLKRCQQPHQLLWMEWHRWLREQSLI